MNNLLKTALLTLIAVSLAVLPSNARTDFESGADRMDLQLRMLVDMPGPGKAILGKAITVADDVELVDVLIKTNDPEITSAWIEDVGGIVRSTVNDIMTANVPTAELVAMSALPEVVAIEASKELTWFMDTARSVANTDVASVQSTYTGTNVVVGVIDSGLDYSNSDFADPNGGTRVEYLRFQSVQGDGSVSITQCAKDYIDDGDCPIAATNDSAIGHGTHVTGIAAGSDSTYMGVAPSANIMLVRNDFADDLEEGTGSFSSGVIDGVVEIFKKSDIIDKPAVINISQGTHIGAHDNTSLMEEALNSAVTGGYATDGKSYGRVITAAAGNEHTVQSALDNAGVGTWAGGIHAEMSVPDGSSYAWRLWVVDSESPGRTPLVIDAWFGTGQASNCTVAANAYTYNDIFSGTFDPPAAAPQTSAAKVNTGDLAISAEPTASVDDGVAAIVAATDASDSQNSKPRAIFSWGPASGTSWDDIAVVKSDGSTNADAYFLDVIVRASGGACSGDIWIEGGATFVGFMGGIEAGGGYNVVDGSKGNGYSMRDGDNDQTVAIPGTASGVIAVGAYLQTKPVGGCSDSCWTDIDSAQHDATGAGGTVAENAQAQINGGTVQARCPFSSIGPPAYTYSGYKPDVMAPGDPIISVLASGYAPAYDGAANRMVLADSSHFKGQGTSQASPHVAGIVALLLTKNNTLTASQVKNALTTTASGGGNNQVGWGNVDAAEALDSVSSDTGGYSGTGNLSQDDLNGGGGSTGGSCGGSIVPTAATSASPIAIIALLPLLLAVIRRR